jgi:nucleoid-associated protein YgaU
MPTLVKNLLFIVGLVVVAVVLIRWADQADGPSVPKAAIKGARDQGADFNKDNDLPPRVLQVSPATKGHGVVSPIAPLQGSSYAEPTPTGSFPISPTTSPVDLPGVDGNLTEETPTPASYGEYQLPPALEPQESPADGPQLAPETEDSQAAASLVEADPPQQRTSRIITGPGDSFWSISEKAYGSGAYYRALFRHNRNQVLRPDQLKAGIKIDIPPLETLRALYPNDFPEVTSDG